VTLISKDACGIYYCVTVYIFVAMQWLLNINNMSTIIFTSTLSNGKLLIGVARHNMQEK